MMQTTQTPQKTWGDAADTASDPAETILTSELKQTPTTLDAFERACQQWPNRLAIEFEDQQLSYRNLNELAESFADNFRSKSIGHGVAIGLSIERRPEAIAAMLGAWKVGALFVPLDPEYPVDRIRFMLNDAQVRFIVTHDRNTNPLFQNLHNDSTITWIDSADYDFHRDSSSMLENETASPEDGETNPEIRDSLSVEPHDLAYIMYTSGSTGMPKGVLIDHRALVTYCLADIEVYKLERGDRTLQFSTLNFDIAIEEIFPPLLIGSCVVIRPRERASAANELSAIINEYGVTAIHLATAYWHEWTDLMLAGGESVPASLRLVIATGEKVSVEHFRRWQTICDQELLWCNAYGPTEATVTSTVFIPTPEFTTDPMPIGKPLPGYTAYILDEDLRELKPFDSGSSENKTSETGQLFIGGPALSRGYLNRDDLNEAAFLNVALGEETCAAETTTRLYRTGDLARWLPSGDIEFAGRVDHQIKLGSYRIEPGEIEAVMNTHPDVRESLIVYEQIDAQKTLVAYVATGAQVAEANKPGKFDSRAIDLYDFLTEKLPSYMVPARYCFLEAFPKTINGKIDRKALPSPSEATVATRGEITAARNGLERHLVELWKTVLNVPQLGIHDDFFALGGSSLLVTRVVAGLTKDLQHQLPVRDFFANPTIASLAAHLQQLIAPDVLKQFGIEPSEAMIQDAQSDQLALKSRQPIIHPAFIGPASRQIFCVRYEPPESPQPESRQGGKRHGVVLCHPLGHEYTRSFRNLQQLALLLSQRGFDVLRFDYYGSGNSAGNCASTRKESMQADLRRAAEHLRETSHCDHLSLVGLRLGATVAATAAVENVSNIVLWDPVVHGADFIELLESLNKHALTSQTRFNQVVAETRVQQLFGHAWNEEKRTSISHLNLPPPKCDRNLVIFSDEYQTAEKGCNSLDSTWNVTACNDELYWHRSEFTESAFSSPLAFQQIIQYLEQGAER